MSINRMIKPSTIHTARTLMFEELSKVMNFSIEKDNYHDSMVNNIFGKKSEVNLKQTTKYLTQLYSFDLSYPPFKILKYFWLNTDENEKPIIALLFAIQQDYLLTESISVVAETILNDKVEIEKMEANLEKYHPNRFTKNTLRSVAQNIASSWKQAGFITGKVKNIRTQPEVTYNCVAFAFIMAYLNGLRGDFIVSSKWVKALCINENQLHELAIEASKRGLIQYQFSGNVTSITCNELFKKLEINDI
jgi:hypothetical protein